MTGDEGQISPGPDPKESARFQHARARSWLLDRIRNALALVFAVASIFCTAALELPQKIEEYLAAGCIIVVLLVIYGPNAIVNLRRLWRRTLPGMRALPALRGDRFQHVGRGQRAVGVD